MKRCTLWILVSFLFSAFSMVSAFASNERVSTLYECTDNRPHELDQISVEVYRQKGRNYAKVIDVNGKIIAGGEFFRTSVKIRETEGPRGMTWVEAKESDPESKFSLGIRDMFGPELEDASVLNSELKLTVPGLGQFNRKMRCI